jgi:hypothetical protein
MRHTDVSADALALAKVSVRTEAGRVNSRGLTLTRFVPEGAGIAKRQCQPSAEAFLGA